MTHPHTIDLLNTERVTITIKKKDADGRFEKLPVEEELAIENSNPDALKAWIGLDHAGAPALLLERLVAEASDIRIEVTSPSGMTPVALLVNIKPEAATKGLDLDVLNANTIAIGPPPPVAPAAKPTPAASDDAKPVEDFKPRSRSRV